MNGNSEIAEIVDPFELVNGEPPKSVPSKHEAFVLMKYWHRKLWDLELFVYMYEQSGYFYHCERNYACDRLDRLSEFLGDIGDEVNKRAAAETEEEIAEAYGISYLGLKHGLKLLRDDAGLPLPAEEQSAELRALLVKKQETRNELADNLQARGPRGPEIDRECPPLELPRQPFPWEDEAFQLESESRTRSVSLPSETVKQAGEWN